jgi:hypothetical protein
MRQLGCDARVLLCCDVALGNPPRAILLTEKACVDFAAMAIVTASAANA